jgi:hypothetical protein
MAYLELRKVFGILDARNFPPQILHSFVVSISIHTIDLFMFIVSAG